MKKVCLVVVLSMLVALIMGGIAAAENDDPSPVPVESVSLNLESMELVLGGQPGILRATIDPPGATNTLIHWSSSNDNVATVEASSDAVVTPVGAGTAVITAVTDDGNFTATCEVTVNPDAPTPPTGSGVLLPLLGLGGALVLTGTTITWKKLKS